MFNSKVWRDYVAEFSMKSKDEHVWFHGHVREFSTEEDDDKIQLEVPRDRWTKMQVRTFEGVWEISIDGGRWREVTPVKARGGPTGGFGFLVEPGGACEVRDVRVKVLSTD